MLFSRVEGARSNILFLNIVMQWKDRREVCDKFVGHFLKCRPVPLDANEAS